MRLLSACFASAVYGELVLVEFSQVTFVRLSWMMVRFLRATSLATHYWTILVLVLSEKCFVWDTIARPTCALFQARCGCGQ
jgi:hypothetical protein